MLCPDEDDEIMAEVRRMRDEYAAEFGYDEQKMWEAHMRHQEEFPHRYVCFDKDDPHCVPDTWRYEDFFTRSRSLEKSVPNESTDAKE
jgi:hypothetical protein